MSTIDTRSSFFPRGGNIQTESTKQGSKVDSLKKNSAEKATEITIKTAQDAKVSIGDGIKDFSKIKRVANAAPEIDNTDKIARLKAQIQGGTYEVDYDALADKILSEEF
jgi:negative regulator of flagellin synthesis FlgM